MSMGLKFFRAGQQTYQFIGLVNQDGEMLRANPVGFIVKND